MTQAQAAIPIPIPIDADMWAHQELAAVEAALEAWVPQDAPAGLGQAMRYGVLDGGKRLRPLLVLASCQAVAGDRNAALRAAVAVELIHAYSLVHDDMPCMDNDVLRRGKPTVHVKHGEAQAMLAGDAMQALAFEVLTPDEGMSAELQARLTALLARSAGHAGMAGGQAIDLASIGHSLDEAALRAMHRRTTGRSPPSCSDRPCAIRRSDSSCGDRRSERQDQGEPDTREPSREEGTTGTGCWMQHLLILSTHR